MKNIQVIDDLKILFLEDEKQDVELMKRELKASRIRFTYKQVMTRKEFLDGMENFNPDIVIADYSLPSFNGMHAFKLFKDKKRNIPFLLVTGSLDEDLALECLTEGVDDILLKSNFARLPSKIVRAVEMKQMELEKNRISDELEKSKKELDALREQSRLLNAQEQLSNREYEILCLIASGKSIKEIADELFLSPSTVATYRARILEKMDLRSNVEITRYAILNKLIQ
jgi:DNA-binding NarL/FixJ family response regulator